MTVLLTVCSVFVAENAAGDACVNAHPNANVGTVAVAVSSPLIIRCTDDDRFPSFWKYPGGTVIAGHPLVAVTADAVGTDAVAACEYDHSSSEPPK